MPTVEQAPNQPFLGDRDPTGWVTPAGFPTTLKPAGYFAQDAAHGLQVVLGQVIRKPLTPVAGDTPHGGPRSSLPAPSDRRAAARGSLGQGVTSW